MKNKTCGECKHCSSCCSWVNPDINANSCGRFEPKVITNADKIRQMSDDELAALIVLVADDHGDMCKYCKKENCKNQTCDAGVLAWLKQEAKDE